MAKQTDFILLLWIVSLTQKQELPFFSDLISEKINNHRFLQVKEGYSNINLDGRPFHCLNSPLFLHNGELTLHYFLTVDLWFSSMASLPRTKGYLVFASYPQHNAFNIEMISQLFHIN